MCGLHTYPLLIYVDDCLRQVNTKIKWLNAILAFASCGAVAGWMMNNELLTLWSVIIAVSQTISALKPHLFNWEKDSWAMKLASSELHAVFINMEKDWYAVSNGQLEEQEIHDLWLTYKKQIERIIEANLDASMLAPKIWNTSFSKSKYYFNTYYPVKEVNQIEQRQPLTQTSDGTNFSAD